MKNEDTPGTPEQPWNTNEVVFGGITCKQLSHLCTGFISALRMANGEATAHGIKGQMNLVATLINQQLALANSPDISAKDRKIVEANLATSLQAVCLAGLFSVNQIDIRHMVGIGISTISMIHKLSETTGPIGADEEVIIQIRRNEELGEDSVEMGVRLEPSSDIEEKMDSSNLGKVTKKISEGPALSPPDIGPYEQGAN